MSDFRIRSSQVIATPLPDFQLICNEVIMFFAFSAYEGLRTDAKQLEYFLDGKSKLDPRIRILRSKAKHLIQVDGYSHAVDAAPYPIDFSSTRKKRERFYYMGGIFKAVAQNLFDQGKTTHLVRWGGDWDKDDHFDDQSFDDLPHYELYKP